MACAGSDAESLSEAEAAPEADPAAVAAVGQPLESEGWTVTLVESAEKRQEVFSAEAGEMGGEVVTDHFQARGYTSVAMAGEGMMWLILGIEVTNGTGDMALLSKRLLTVTGPRGNTYEWEGMMVHIPHIWADERWMKEENYLMGDVIDDGVTREGPIIYEVPDGATGLTLVMQGIDETIDLGL